MLDFHTHRPNPDSIFNIPFEKAISDAYGEFKYLSAGIHPWNTEAAVIEDYKALGKLAEDERIVAIGECGIDKLRGADLQKQEAVFIGHVALSERLKKPLIIHCVKAYQQILKLKRDLNPAQTWVIHGFRGNGILAKQLLDKSIRLSFGEKFNPEALKAVGAENLLIETDDSETPIEEITANIASHFEGCTLEQIMEFATANALAVIGK